MAGSRERQNGSEAAIICPFSIILPCIILRKKGDKDVLYHLQLGFGVCKLDACGTYRRRLGGLVPKAT